MLLKRFTGNYSVILIINFIIKFFKIVDFVISKAKAKLVYEIFKELKAEREIKFEVLSKKYNLDIEDIEETLFEGEQLKLFSVSLDYKEQVIKIKHVNLGNVDKAQVDNLKQKINLLKSKLTAFVRTVDSLAA